MNEEFALDYREVAHRLRQVLDRMDAWCEPNFDVEVIGWLMVEALCESYPQFNWKNTLLDL